MSELYCPGCGESVEQLHEGYCEECLQARQIEFNHFNHWNGLTDAERDFLIREAMK